MCDDPMKRAERRCRRIGTVGLCAVLLALVVTMALSALGLGLRTPVLAVLLLAVLVWVLLLGGCMLHALYLWAHSAAMIRKVGFICAVCGRVSDHPCGIGLFTARHPLSARAKDRRTRWNIVRDAGRT